ncbi:hypothetical protein Bca52824_035350 [Brassica carinata]|uniref:Uncharacterized protein n=1 Tax=Brassica carinata TaxID=52824 RepID=A0A8X7S433_BRACI|nr:hypothetical protein Bca52824_035350 [Brassica carinata]
MKLSGVSDSAKKNGGAAVLSTPVKSGLKIGDASGDVNSGKPADGSPAPSAPVKPVVQTGFSSGVRTGVRGRASVSSADKGKGIVADNGIGDEITFKDSKTLIGLEMILIDREETVIQGFIPQGRVDVYLSHLKAGALYRLNKFFGAKSKLNYRVAEPDVTISFSWNSALTPLEDSSIRFPEDRFRIHGYRTFDAACDLRGDLYDYIGHIKLVNGQVPGGNLLLDEADVAASRRVDLHVQTHDDPVLKVCLWDKAAFEFVDKFNATKGTARVILVTTLNPKRFGVLSLSSMAPSRVFLDDDVEETRVYLNWLNSNSDVANRINAEVVTKPETATLGDLFAYMKRPSAKVAWFECTATIDAVVHGSDWYYIGCGVCHTKATRGPTTLIYLSKLSVYDQKDQAIFVLLGNAGEELTGKKAGEFVESYYQANDAVEGEHKVPVPRAMIDTIGQRRRLLLSLGEKSDEEPVSGSGDHAEVSVKRVADVSVPEGGKRRSG